MASFFIFLSPSHLSSLICVFHRLKQSISFCLLLLQGVCYLPSTFSPSPSSPGLFSFYHGENPGGLDECSYHWRAGPLRRGIFARGGRAAPGSSALTARHGPCQKSSCYFPALRRRSFTVSAEEHFFFEALWPFISRQGLAKYNVEICL